MQLTPKLVKHLVVPGYEQSRSLPLHGETITEFLERVEWDINRIPTICVIDGAPVLRSEWAVIRADIQEVTFISRPHGGGSSGGGSKAIQIGAIVAMIALAAAAPWAAGILAPIFGITSAVGVSALAAGITLGGGMLISTLVKLAAGGQNDKGIPDADQVYSLQAAANSARPLGVIPVNYGRLKRLPDYGSQPWSEFISNEQYMNLQLTVGVGKHFIEQILIDDTILWTDGVGTNPQFSNVQIEFCPPGTPITIFPTNVEQSSEVSGQELPGPDPAPDTWVGGFIANASGTLAYRLVIDVVFPGGLYFINRDGDYFNSSVQLVIEYRTVDSAGTPTGSWVPYAPATIVNKTKTPIRLSFPFDVDPGRYEVRMNRQGLPNGAFISGGIAGIRDTEGTKKYTIQQNTGNTTSQDQVNWIGLRAYIQGSSNYEYEYNIAIRMKADAQLSSQSSRQMGVISTRILPVWNGTIFEDEPTKNPVWAFWDAATNATYGAKRPLSKVDFQAVYIAAQAADTRGDTFNYTFKDFVTVPDALDTILASARSKHCWIGDVLSLVRDEWHEIPSVLLTDHHIVRGSLEVISIFNDETGVDSIIGEFLNENTWRPAEIQFPPNTVSFTSQIPSRIRLPGVTDPEHMLREVGFLWSQSQLRRTKVNLSTGHEGQMLKLMSAVAIQSHLPTSWGQSGEVISLAVDGVTIKTDKDLVFDGVNPNYVEFRDKRGRYFGPIICDSVGGDPTKLELDASDLAAVETDQGMTIEEALDRMDGAEPPVFVLGVASNLSRRCQLLQARPNGDTVDLVMVVDDIDVHDDDYGDTGDFPEPPPVLNPLVPMIALMTATFRMSVAEAVLDCNWWPAPGALGYIAQISYDEGVTWEGVYEGSAPQFSKVVTPAELDVRVQAFHTIRGPWAQVTVAAPTIRVQPGAVNPESMIQGLEDYVMRIISENDAVANNIRQMIVASLAELDAQHYTNQQELRRNLKVVEGNISASFSEVITVAIGPGGAIAVALQELEVQIGDVSASVTQQSVVIGDIQGNLAASWGLTLDVNNYVTGLYLLNDGTTSAVVFNTDNFSIAKPGVLTPTTIFSLQTVNGVSTMALKGDFIADGTVKAISIDVVSLSSINADMGSLTTGKIESPDGKFLIDCTNKRIVISD